MDMKTIVPIVISIIAILIAGVALSKVPAAPTINPDQFQLKLQLVT